jgi:hypothetical protein
VSEAACLRPRKWMASRAVVTTRHAESGAAAKVRNTDMVADNLGIWIVTLTTRWMRELYKVEP